MLGPDKEFGFYPTRMKRPWRVLHTQETRLHIGFDKVILAAGSKIDRKEVRIEVGGPFERLLR